MTDVKQAGTLTWTRSATWLLRMVFLLVLAVCVIDLVRALRTEHALANAAHEAARITIATPLNASNCRDRTPCSIQSAATAAKRSLRNTGLGQASCINPKTPSLSGVLVWVFSCDGSRACDTSDETVCLKIDMTPVVVRRNGTLIPYTRVTVQYPHRWALGSVLERLPGRPAGLLPKTLSANALMRD